MDPNILVWVPEYATGNLTVILVGLQVFVAPMTTPVQASLLDDFGPCPRSSISTNSLSTESPHSRSSTYPSMIPSNRLELLGIVVIQWSFALRNFKAKVSTVEDHSTTSTATLRIWSLIQCPPCPQSPWVPLDWKFSHLLSKGSTRDRSIPGGTLGYICPSCSRFSQIMNEAEWLEEYLEPIEECTEAERRQFMSASKLRKASCWKESRISGTAPGRFPTRLVDRGRTIFRWWSYSVM